jgi:hypothetical protein
MAKPKRRGRPTTKGREGEKATLSIGASAALKGQLQEAADRNGRSLSQEAELRLEQTFREEGLFSSPECRRWAILLAGEFHKAGTAAAGHASVDTADRAWMNDPSCLLQASFSVMDALLRDLERQPGADLPNISTWLEQLKQRFDIRHRILRFQDKSGEEMGSLGSNSSLGEDARAIQGTRCAPRAAAPRRRASRSLRR